MAKIEVTYFYRENRVGNFSIENVFAQIINQIKDYVVVKKAIRSGNEPRLISILRVNRYSSQINHITGDVYYLALGLPSKTTILTIHDVGHYEMTLKGTKRLIYKWIWLSLPFRKAGHITAISNFTKTKLIKLFGINEEKIKVIYNPLPDGYHIIPKEFNKEKPVILQIGAGRNKNIEGLVEAVKGISCKLLLIGFPNKQIISRLNLNGTEFEYRSNLTAQELYTAYSEADLLFFASWYEGFGVPIIEAQAVGRPVITSNICSMPEVAGQGALLVDPGNIDSIREGILRIIHDPILRKNLIEAGLRNIQRFDREQIAAQYVALYKEVLTASKH